MRIYQLPHDYLCACEFDGAGLVRWSVEWHLAHQAHHLAVFPGVDQRTRDNLAHAVEWARRTSQQRASSKSLTGGFRIEDR